MNETQGSGTVAGNDSQGNEGPQKDANGRSNGNGKSRNQAPAKGGFTFLKEKVADVYRWLYVQFREPSTWRGFVMVATSLTAWNNTPQPTKTDVIVFIGLFVVGLIGVLTSDQPK